MLSISKPGHYSLEEEDFVYTQVQGLALRAHSYRPIQRAEPVAAVIDIHGGAWNFNDRMAGDHYNRALASAGLYVLALDFRQGPDHKHPSASTDIQSGIDYLLEQSDDLNIDTTKLGLIGSSSGGHLALLTGLTQETQQIHFVIALWPVSDPFYRYQYAQKARLKRLVTAHENYFNSEADMQQASIQRILAEQDFGAASSENELPENELPKSALPKIMLVEPGKDKNIPREMTAELITQMQAAEIHFDYQFYPEEAHAFGHLASKATDRMVNAMVHFIEQAL